MSLQIDDLKSIVEDIIHAGKQRVDNVEVTVIRSSGLAAAVRLGNVESVTSPESTSFGVRVFHRNRPGIFSGKGGNLRVDLRSALENAIAMAQVTPESPLQRPADPDLILVQKSLYSPVDLDLFDATELDGRELAALALETEDAARAVAGITNSEGAEARWSKTIAYRAGNNGLDMAHKLSSFSFAASVLAGAGENMEGAYAGTGGTHLADLDSPDYIGRRAALKAVKALNPRKIESAQMPVVLDRGVASSLIGHFAAASNGIAMRSKTTFLAGLLGKAVFSPAVTIIDDPLMPREGGSRIADDEGIASRLTKFVDGGIFSGIILDLQSARMLNMTPSGHGALGSTAEHPGPSPSNIYIANGSVSYRDMIGDIEKGLYVTNFIGSSINMATGEYSRGASGFMIENGELAYPVSGVTIGSVLYDENGDGMFQRITPANDLDLRRYASPSLRIDGMMVAGK